MWTCLAGKYWPHLSQQHHSDTTAITTAEIILKEQDDYTKWKLTEDDLPKENILPVTSQRIPNVPGTHEIKYESAIDQLSLTHEAKSRKGFALGAIIAAEWLKDRKGTYTMSDIINITWLWAFYTSLYFYWFTLTSECGGNPFQKQEDKLGKPLYQAIIIL